MPVWHVSIARSDPVHLRVLRLSEWRAQTFRNAREIAHKMLLGVGGDWQMEEVGESALHTRRRLSAAEMGLLFQVNNACPVFTHGAARQAMEGQK